MYFGQTIFGKTTHSQLWLVSTCLQDKSPFCNGKIRHVVVLPIVGNIVAFLSHKWGIPRDERALCIGIDERRAAFLNDSIYDLLSQKLPFTQADIRVTYIRYWLNLSLTLHRSPIILFYPLYHCNFIDKVPKLYNHIIILFLYSPKWIQNIKYY